VTPLSIGIHISNHGPTSDALLLARAADRAGADTLWLSEDLYFHGAMTLAGAIAAQTTRARIGFSVLTPYGMHVGRLGMEMATLADLAPGRLIAGIGAGVRARIELMQAPWSNPVDRVRQYANALQTLLAGGTLDTDGETDPARGLFLSLENPPGRLPIYVAAVGPKALFQAGELFDGVLLSLMAAAPHLRAARALVDEGAGRANRTPPPVIASIPIRVRADGNAAIAQSKELVAYFMTRWAPIPALRALFVRDGILPDSEFDALVDRLHRGSTASDVVPESIALAHCPAGTVTDVARQLIELSDVGINGFSLDPGPLGSEDETQAALTQIIASIRDQSSRALAATLP
jgi:alkanesulfonate monooxygenase SsuD/methylene tetrahydromethanopterin reductase-like flavin-dependent oxidoreductase (luciferase family)